jgi:dCTP deaminase
MILSNVEIRAIDQGRIRIRPEPLPRVSEPGRDSPYDTHSVDVCLGAALAIPQKGPYSFDLYRPGGPQPQLAGFLAANSRSHTLEPESGFALEPGQFVLGKTVEEISLPIDVPANRESGTCLAARIEGKSSRARTGLLVHFTAPTIHPGFEGTITLEIINLGPVPFVLRPGMPIGQLIFEEVRGLPIPKDSQFQGQTRPEGNV